jgi:hypothetical protein
MHVHPAFNPGNVVSVGIEQSCYNSQDVVIAVVRFPKPQSFHIQACRDSQLSLKVSRLEELSLQVDWNLLDFFPRKYGSLDFLFGDFGRIGRMVRSPLTTPSLNGQIG